MMDRIWTDGSRKDGCRDGQTHRWTVEEEISKEGWIYESWKGRKTDPLMKERTPEWVGDTMKNGWKNGRMNG